MNMSENGALVLCVMRKHTLESPIYDSGQRILQMFERQLTQSESDSINSPEGCSAAVSNLPVWYN